MLQLLNMRISAFDNLLVKGLLVRLNKDKSEFRLNLKLLKTVSVLDNDELENKLKEYGKRIHIMYLTNS